MLKIKDNVDLKELEKFGFKKQFNRDTGKIEEYVCGTNRVSIEKRILEYSKRYDGECYEYFLFDYFIENIFINLIQAGLVVKVEEE